MPAVPSPGGAIRPEILHEAAEWLVRLHDDVVDEADRRAWRKWLASSDEHARAWQRAEQLASLVGGVPGAVGAAPLRRM
ncbi:FecR/PupR family sigma factor regulator, partial [Thauera linaloolentis]